jgi:hypothetical protein
MGILANICANIVWVDITYIKPQKYEIIENLVCIGFEAY